MPNVEFSIKDDNIRGFDGDVLALKYAQEFYGADRAIASLLTQRGIPISNMQPKIDEYKYIATQGCIKAHHVLFVGTPRLIDFDYASIRSLAQKTLSALATEGPYTQHLGMTIHGSRFGLDEAEALLAQFAGYTDALQNGQFPRDIKKISILSNDVEQVERLRQIMEKNLNNSAFARRLGGSGWSYSLSIPSMSAPNRILEQVKQFGNAGTTFPKPHIFVAMPFKAEMYDVFHYGIQRPVHDAGFLCERVDQEAFIGDILDQVKKKIETASVIIAELSGANPNVYLEVGYAWGKGRPTILLAKDEQELLFDIRGQRCLKYKTIKDLEEALCRELKELQFRNLI